MEQKKSSHEFQALIDPDGKIDVPSELVKLFAGRKLHVRLSSEEIVSDLTELGVTESEIERIATLQFEQREQVVKFLLSEGVMNTDSAFVKRATEARR